MLEVEEFGDIELNECHNCGRKFRPDVIKKHEPICLKSSKKRRKVFDSGKQRADGSDIPVNKTLKPGQIPKPDAKIKQAENMTKQWRQRHEALVESLRAARLYTKAKESGGPLPPPPPPVIDPSLIQCPHCQRRFNENASVRHIPFCKEQQARLNSKLAAAVNNKKPTYKAPLPKVRPPPSTNGLASKPQSYGAHSRTAPAPARANPAPKTSASRFQRNTSGLHSNTMTSTGQNRIGSIPKSNGPQRTRPVPSASSTRNVGATSAGKSRPTNTASFCHECGSQYSLITAKFCSECGVRRIKI